MLASQVLFRKELKDKLDLFEEPQVLRVLRRHMLNYINIEELQKAPAASNVLWGEETPVVMQCIQNKEWETCSAVLAVVVVVFCAELSVFPPQTRSNKLLSSNLLTKNSSNCIQSFVGMHLAKIAALGCLLSHCTNLIQFASVLIMCRSMRSQTSLQSTNGDIWASCIAVVGMICRASLVGPRRGAIHKPTLQEWFLKN